MSFRNFRELLEALLTAISSPQVEEILQELGDKSGLELEQEFGDLGLRWHAFGDSESNISTINLASKPVRSLVERVTNSMDALLEKAAEGATSLPASSGAAAKEWFGRPLSGPDDGAFNWDHSAFSNDIAVILQGSGREIAPTVDILDEGIGIKSKDMSRTILSLHKKNKIDKRHLIGAFGQGGSAALAFSEYTVVFSRHYEKADRVAFTIIKKLEMPEGWKEDLYAYLAIEDDKNNLSVPSCEWDKFELPLYPDETDVAVPDLDCGTCVRHVDFRIPGFEKTLGPTSGNLYHALHVTLFDPLVPFRAIDLRTKGSHKNELISGTRNRLMKLAADAMSAKSRKSNTQLRHHKSMEYIVPPGQKEATVGVEYWVVFNYKPQKGKKVLRSHSNELYVSKNYPFVFSLNGQNQGELGAKLLRELGLNMVARHIVVHIDASRAPKKVRSRLFSSDRESLKEDLMLNGLTEYIRDVLVDDDELHAIERELTEKLVNRETATTSDEVKRQVSKLLKDAGLEVRKPGPTMGGSEGGMEGEGGGKKKKPGKKKVKKPLVTKPFPEVTRFEVVRPADKKLLIRRGENTPIQIETDADAEFDNRHLMNLVIKNGPAELAGENKLRGGRKWWRVRPSDVAKVEDEGEIRLEISNEKGEVISDLSVSLEFEVVPPREKKTRKSTGTVPDFDILPINPEDHPVEWEQLGWGELDEKERFHVAYKPWKAGGAIVVYYSTIFTPFRNQQDTLKGKSKAMAEAFRQNYEVWIGYHAILQQQEAAPGSLIAEEKDLEELQEKERARVARIQIRQAKLLADMQLKLIKQGEVIEA